MTTWRSVCRVHNNWFPIRLHRWKSNVYVHIMVSEAGIFALGNTGAYMQRKIHPNFNLTNPAKSNYRPTENEGITIRKRIFCIVGKRTQMIKKQ